jgi:23S rRNA (guanosine2251-2'-O)-methyltransferase
VVIYGINPVREALRAGRVRRMAIGDRHDRRLRELVEEATAHAVIVEVAPRAELDRRARGGVHQGVVAQLAEAASWTLDDLVRDASAPPLLVVLDGIEDPHNLGAILRSCDAAGADGVVRQTRRAAPLDGVVAKASAGALSHVRIADTVNIARSLEELKTLGVWSVGLAAEAEKSYDEVDLTVPVAFVLGAEGAGLRRLVRESCDWLVRIPMRGHVDSLNVSVAAGIVLFEAVRQRRRAGAAAG